MWFWLFLTTKTKLCFFFFLGSCSRALQHVFGVPVWALTWPLLLVFPSTTNESLSFFFFFGVGASVFQHIVALQGVVHALTQIWSPTSCLRRLFFFCRQTSAVHPSTVWREMQDLGSLMLLSFLSFLLSLWCLFLSLGHLLLMISGTQSLMHRSRRRWKDNKF